MQLGTLGVPCLAPMGLLKAHTDSQESNPGPGGAQGRAPPPQVDGSAQFSSGTGQAGVPPLSREGPAQEARLWPRGSQQILGLSERPWWPVVLCPLKLVLGRL